MSRDINENLCVKYSQKNGKGTWDFNYAFLPSGRGARIIPWSYVLNSHRYLGLKSYRLREEKYRRMQKRKNDFHNKNKKVFAAVCIFTLFLSSLVYAKNVIRAVSELHLQTKKYDSLIEEMNQNVLDAFASQKAVINE